jgi:hypothetical protein
VRGRSVARVERPLERGHRAGEEQPHRVGRLVGPGLRLQRRHRGRRQHDRLLDHLPAVDDRGLSPALGLHLLEGLALRAHQLLQPLLELLAGALAEGEGEREVVVVAHRCTPTTGSRG